MDESSASTACFWRLNHDLCVEGSLAFGVKKRIEEFNCEALIDHHRIEMSSADTPRSGSLRSDSLNS